MKSLLNIRIGTVYFAVVAVAISIAWTRTLVAQDASPAAGKPETAILINNARIFDGVSEQLKQGNLLIVGNNIKQISSAPIPAPPQSTIIDAGGRESCRGYSCYIS